MMNIQSIFKKIISYIPTLLIFIVVLEISARVDDMIKYDAPFFVTYKNNLLRSFDEDGLRYNIPSVQFEKWRNNNFGFRGQDIKLDKEERITRIICMGASTTYGLFEDQDKEWPAQLSQILEPSNSYQVINVATVGLRRDHVLKYLDKYVYKLDPDIIIFMISPTFTGVQTEPNLLEKKEKQPPVKKVNVSQFTLSSVIANIRIIPKTWQVIKKFVPDTLLEEYQYWDRTKKINYMEKKYLRGEKPLDTIPVESQNEYREDISNVVTAIQSKGIDVILTTHPFLLTDSTLDEYPLIFMEGRRFNIELSYEGMIESSVLGDSIMQLVSDSCSTGFVDCNGVLPKNTDYFGDNIHLTNLGSEIVAKSIAEYITSH